MSKLSAIKQSRLSKLAIIAVASMALSACGQDISDLQQFVSAEKNKPRPPIPPPPEIKQHETFKYVAGNRRSPFNDLTTRKQARVTSGKQGKSVGPRPVEGRAREALESFSLDSLRMVGVLEQKGTTWALVRDGNGSVHMVKTGNYLGQNHGKIIQITETSIKLSEIVPEGLGADTFVERSATIALVE